MISRTIPNVLRQYLWYHRLYNEAKAQAMESISINDTDGAKRFIDGMELCRTHRAEARVSIVNIIKMLGPCRNPSISRL